MPSRFFGFFNRIGGRLGAQDTDQFNRIRRSNALGPTGLEQTTPAQAQFNPQAAKRFAGANLGNTLTSIAAALEPDAPGIQAANRFTQGQLASVQRERQQAEAQLEAEQRAAELRGEPVPLRPSPSLGRFTSAFSRAPIGLSPELQQNLSLEDLRQRQFLDAQFAREEELLFNKEREATRQRERGEDITRRGAERAEDFNFKQDMTAFIQGLEDKRQEAGIKQRGAETRKNLDFAASLKTDGITLDAQKAIAEAYKTNTDTFGDVNMQGVLGQLRSLNAQFGGALESVIEQIIAENPELAGGTTPVSAPTATRRFNPSTGRIEEVN